MTIIETRAAIAEDVKPMTEGAVEVKPESTKVLEPLAGLLVELQGIDDALVSRTTIIRKNRMLVNWSSNLDLWQNKVSELLGKEYRSDLQHDLAYYPGSIQTVLLREEDSKMGDCRRIIQGIKRIVGSVKQEFEPQIGPVSIDEEINLALDCAWGVRAIAGDENDVEIYFIYGSDSNFIVDTQRDCIFRVFNNLISNSEKAIEERVHLKGLPKKGKVRVINERVGDRIVVTFQDNGIGFRRYFKKIRFSSDEEQIPLREIVDRAQEIGELGRGLRVCQHLAELAGVEIFVTNPKLVGGGEVKVLLEAA